MKKQSIIAQGHCGLTVELNLMDQYAISHAVERYDKYLEAKKVHEEWAERRNKEKVWNMEREARKEWEIANPEPEFIQPTWEEELKPIYTFLRKLILPEGSKATVFDEE